MATQDDYIRTALRVPPDLHAQLHEAAKGNNRTFNAEIVARLQESFDGVAILTPEEHAGLDFEIEKYALRLQALQSKRDAVSLLLRSMQEFDAKPDKVLRVQSELAALDLAIKKLIISMQEEHVGTS